MSYVPPPSQVPPPSPRQIPMYNILDYSTLYTTTNYASSYMEYPPLSSRPMDDASTRKIEYFSMDDLKYGDVALRNLKTVLRKRRIRNIDECISILENLSPRSLEQMVKNIVNKNNKDSVVKMLRKLKLSDPIVMHQ